MVSGKDFFDDTKHSVYRYYLKNIYLIFKQKSTMVFALKTIAKRVLQASVVAKVNIIVKAFTLAEVLIVLGIIGLIADMTIPTLFQNIDKQVTVVKVQKAYTELSQAVELSEIDNGPVSEWELGPHSFETSEKYFNTYLKPYLKIMRECEKGANNGTYVTECGASVSAQALNFVLANGVGMSITTEPTGTSLGIDTNGSKGPNRTGKDLFTFDLKPQSGFIPAYFKKGITREELINGHTDTEGNTVCCKKNGCAYQWNTCTALIMMDNWKIADDYPW